MVHKWAVCAAVVIGTSGVSTAQQASAPKAAIQGVWKVVEVTTTGPSGGTVANVQPRLLIITRDYYSRTEVIADSPRPPLTNAAAASADELRATWGPFIAEAGTYQLENGHFTTARSLVAKNPGQMSPTVFVTYSYKLEADTMWMTNQKTQNGPVQNPTTYKYTRVE